MNPISTEISSLSRAFGGEEKAIYQLAKAGFDAWDFSMFGMMRYDYKNRRAIHPDHPLAGPNYLSFARRLKQIGQDNGVYCNQSHAPFPVCDAEIRGTLKRAIECTAEAGGRICVIHPDNDKSAEENAEMYFELLPFAKEHGVKIATENMWNRDPETRRIISAACSHHDDFLAHVLAVNDPYLVACVDVGHAEILGLDTNAPTMLRTLGSHVQALHLHDVDLVSDSHQLPFTLKVDFEAIARALHDIGYSGELTLESTVYLGTCPPEQLEEGVRNMAAAARRIGEMMENCTQ